MYWTWSRVTSIVLHSDGSNVDTLVTDLDDPRSSALDVGGRPYVLDSIIRIIRVQFIVQNLDGSNDRNPYVFSDDTRGLALDVAGGYMYWTEWA